MFIVFFICEIAPIVVLLDYSYYMQTLMRGGFLTSQATSLAGDDASLLSDQDYYPARQPGNTNNSTRLNSTSMPADTEGDSLLLQRQLPTMDHLLLSTPSNVASQQPGSRNQSRRVRFQADGTDDPLLESP
jgi:hypothetical protein